MKKFIGSFLIMLFALVIFGRADASVQCPNLTQTLRKGASHAEVSLLQRFLADYPGMYPEGEVTGYFGSLTEKALQRFQARHGIASSGSPSTNGYGLLGPKTRAMINAVCGELNSGEVPAPPTAEPTSGTPSENLEKKGFYAPTLPYFDPNRIEVATDPKMDLKVDGSDGPLTVIAGSDVTLSWTLSAHNWWYCGKLRDWSGSITSPASGSEILKGIHGYKVFRLNCYVDNRVFEDEVVIQTVPAPTVTPAPASAASPLKAGIPYDGPFGKIDCALSIWPSKIIYLEDGPPSVRWQVQSSPTYDWHFYWHESVDGGPYQHIYRGITTNQAANNVSKLETYNHKPTKIRRYAHVVIDQKHYPDTVNPVHPDTVCTTNEIEFEIKESRTSSAFSKSFANLFNAIFPYIDIGGY